MNKRKDGVNADLNSERTSVRKTEHKNDKGGTIKNRSYIIAIVLFIVMLFIKPHVIALLDIIEKWLNACYDNRIWFAILFSSLCLCVSRKEIIKIKKKEQRVASSTMATAMCIVLFYSFFRFVDKTYEFWGIGWYKWSDILYIPFAIFLYRAIVCNRKRGEILDQSCPHISDKAIDNPLEDEFNYDWMSESLLADLSTIDLREKSFSVGVVGIWGQGKSSFINLFKRHVLSKDNTVVVEFYPRASKTVNSIQEDFFKVFKGALKKYHTGIERYISNYARDVAKVDQGWVGKLAMAFSHLSAEEGMNRINSILRSFDRRVFVLIEDLDRLTGEEILEVFKLIDRNGNFCNTIFVTAYDKKYVNGVVRAYLKTSYKDYSDKYFDYEYTLPLHQPSVLKSFADRFLSSRLSLEQESAISLEQLRAAWGEHGGFIVDRLETMRHIKRYLNVFMSRYPKVKNDVDASDFMLLTLLRYVDLTAYNAIPKFSFIKEGNAFSNKLIYLRNDYEERLQALHISGSSKEIIEKLFHKEDSSQREQIYDVYHKLRWAESFNSYFYDYRIGKYHIEDFQRLFKIDDEEVFDIVRSMQEDGVNVPLIDFLKSRRESWIEDANGLTRLIKIMVYLNSLERSFDLDLMISGMLFRYIMNEYVRVHAVASEAEYKSIIHDLFSKLIEQYPVEIGFACIRVNDEVIKGKAAEENLVFSLKEIVDMAVGAQKCYYKRYESGNYLMSAILNLAKIYEKRGNSIQVVEPAKREIVALMNRYPERFAKDVVLSVVEEDHDGKAFLKILFNRSFDYERMLAIDSFSFLNWVESLSDKKFRYVVKRLYETENKALQVPALKKDYNSGDFNGYYDAVKSFDDGEDEKTIREVIDKRISFDYSVLNEITGIDITRIKAAVERLVAKKLIDSKFSNLKDRMDPFEKGDFVKFLDEKYESYSKQVFYSDNVFKIVELLPKESLRLADIKEAVPLGDVEAVPVDREHDRGIYYDPTTMATIVMPGQSVPPSYHDTSEYYMDAFENSRFEEITLKEIVDRDNCQFVHEVQHSLRKRFGRDDMRLNKSIKNH